MSVPLRLHLESYIILTLAISHTDFVLLQIGQEDHFVEMMEPLPCFKQDQGKP